MIVRTWNINIPVRPKAVQSTRGGRGHFYVDPKVRKWKDQIRPYIQAASEQPSDLPIRITRLDYYFKAPAKTPAGVLRYIKAGGYVPYLVAADLTDNLSKGLIDVCRGIIFIDDRQICWICDARKRYGIEDKIEILFEEMPDVLLIDGVRAEDK